MSRDLSKAAVHVSTGTGQDGGASHRERVDDNALDPTDLRARVRAWRIDRSALSSIGLAAFLVIVAARVLTVDLGGIVTNDSLGYLRRAEAPFGAGFVFQGYRQAGYPMFVAVSNLIGDVFGWDHIFGVALLQRSVLVVALALLAWSLRWWSAPILVFASSSSFVVQTDFILTEGLLIPGCLVVGGLLAAVTVGRIRSVVGGRAVLVAASVLAALCASMKLQYAALLALAAAIAWLLHRDGLFTRRFALVALGSASLVVGALAFVQSVENRSALGVFEPIAERHRSKWWGAWQVVFTLNPDNRDEPALAEYYDDGDLYTFLHGVEREVGDYTQRRDMVEDRIESMFLAAGMSPRGEQVAALLGAVRGGRTDDLSGIVDGVLAADRGDPLIRLTRNSEFQTGGVEGIIEGFNDGLRPGVMTTGPLLDVSQRVVDDYRVWRSRVGIVAIALMLGSLLVRGRHRPAVLATLAMVLAVALAMASGYTDNARYLLGPLAVGVVGGTLGLRALTTSPHAHALRDKALLVAGSARGGTGSEHRTLEHEEQPEREDAAQ